MWHEVNVPDPRDDGKPGEPREDDGLQHIEDKYFPMGIDDESVNGEPYTPTPGAW